MFPQLKSEQLHRIVEAVAQFVESKVAS